MKKIAISVVALLSVLASPLYAATPGTYVGAGLGYTNLNTSNKFFPYYGGPITKSSITSHTDGVGGKLFAGYNFNQYFGLEAGYNRFAQSRYTNSAVIAPGITQSGNSNYSMYAFDLVAKGYLPVSDSGFNLYALAGLAYATATHDYYSKRAGGVIADNSVTTSKIRPMYGVGASYDIPQSPMTANVELTRIQGSGNYSSQRAIPSANMASFSLAYNFN